jgi:DNA repair exonuclease SbcCD nuclease subunit
MPERRPLRAVHTSDVHFGAYVGNANPQWEERRRLIEQAFGNVIDLANDTRADLLLLCGDIFDNDRVPPETVEYAAREIGRFDGRAILVPGNHDPMDPGSLYWRHDMEGTAGNLRILREHAGGFIEDDDVVLWGRAYLDTDWHFRPFEGLPQRKDDRWHIALGHGHFVHAGGEQNRSMLIQEAEIAAAAGQWDYVALGHWEPHADVSCGGATAVYSGAPMPLSDANRRAGWAAVVDFDEQGVRWRLERVDPRPHPFPEGEAP